MAIGDRLKAVGVMAIAGGCAWAALLFGHGQDATPAAAAANRAAPRVPPAIAWAPKPVHPGGWTAPMKPVWRLSRILAAHKGQADWTQTIVDDHYLHADYISMGPGGKTPRRFNADTREWWIVQDGQIRFAIDGQEPFIAGKGFMVQVPYRNAYSMETVGDKPSLRFEVNIAGATKEYPADEKPPDIPGMEFVRIRVASKGTYEEGNKPYFDFNDVISGKVRSNNFVKDDRAVVNIIRGRGAPDPGPAANGHFHASSSEFWFIMEGQVRYAMETQPTFVAEQGDVVYAPMGMWHLASSAGSGMSTRIAMNGYVDLAHHYMAH